jgi:SAM-dependent methyltransferase
MKRWWLDEVAHAGDEHLDAGYVAGYDRKAGFDPSEDLDVLGRHGFGPDSTLVDLGAGTGTFAVAAARRCRRVIAVDVSASMRAAMLARAESGGIANLTVVGAGLLSYEHHGQAADFVYTRHALHQIPDFWKAIALQRIRSVLRPGGVLRLRDLVFDFDPADADERVEAWMSGAVSDPSVGWTADELAEHVRGEHSTYSWLLEAMLDRTGFDVVGRTYSRAAYGAYTCIRRDA